MKSRTSLIDSRWIAQIERLASSGGLQPKPEPGELIRLLRTYLRIPQTELAHRAKITQPHLASIEAGHGDPQWGTLKRIFEAMRIDIGLLPLPVRPLKELLRGRARSATLKRLKQTMGTMALEEQAPDKEQFRELLEKRTDELLEQRKRFRSGHD